MRIAIIGCGIIGEKRAKALSGHQLVIVADKNIERARYIGSLSKEIGRAHV